MKIVAIETNVGTLTVAEAIAKLASGKFLNTTWSQVVLGVYADGRKTSLKGWSDGRRAGFSYMSGNNCDELAL